MVQPAYWGRGHGSALARWGVQLAGIDGVKQGVLASSMGSSLFEHVGFKKLADVSIPGDEEDPSGSSLVALRYDPDASQTVA